MAYKITNTPINWDELRTEKIYGTVVRKTPTAHILKIQVHGTNTYFDFNTFKFPEEKLKDIKAGVEGCFTFNIYTRRLGRTVLYLRDFEETLLIDNIPDNNEYVFGGASIEEIREIINNNYFILLTLRMSDKPQDVYTLRMDRKKLENFKVGDLCNVHYRLVKSKNHVVLGKVLEFREKDIDVNGLYTCEDEYTWINKEGEAQIGLYYTQVLDVTDIEVVQDDK